MSSKNSRRNPESVEPRGQDDPDDRLPEWAPVERIAYDRTSGGYRARYDPDESTEIGVAVALAVAAVAETAPDAGEPLTDAIDIDALNRLFDPSRPADGRDLEVQFRYRDCTVRVDDEGWITVVPEDASSD